VSLCGLAAGQGTNIKSQEGRWAGGRAGGQADGQADFVYAKKWDDGETILYYLSWCVLFVCLSACNVASVDCQPL